MYGVKLFLIDLGFRACSNSCKNPSVDQWNRRLDNL